MALVMNSQNIDIEGLDFDGSGIEQDEVVGINYGGSTGSITDVTVSDVAGSEMGVGISVWGGEIDTVEISDTTVDGCQIGVMVYDDQVNLVDCIIIGLEGGDDIGIYALYGAVVNIESCTIYDFWVGVSATSYAYLMTEFAPKTAVLAPQFTTVDGGSPTVEITECSTITDNSYGIYVDDGVLVANGNDIAGNYYYGIYNDGATEVDAERNWWGDAQGPTHEDNPFFATTTGDEVSDNVDYLPWLDAPCPYGNPTPGGPQANFVAEPRSGIAPLDVQLTDLSTSDFDIVSWAWDLGDGTTSAQQNPAHTYSMPGTYRVSLTVTDELGLSDTETKSAYIIVHQELPAEGVSEPANLKAAYFLISPEQVMPNQQVEISINIGNDGGSVGTRNVALYINGVLEDSQTVTVSPGSSQLVVFIVTRAEPGTYQVLLEGNEGQFTVLGRADGQWAGPLGTGGIIAIVVFVIALVLGLVFILRRE
jgi:PKD repeat protein